jgi:hypothetical protein
MEDQVQESLELLQFGEQVYQLELRAYHIGFPKFKYVPLDFVSIKIRTGTKTIGATSHIYISEQKEQIVVILKPNSPLRNGTCL